MAMVSNDIVLTAADGQRLAATHFAPEAGAAGPATLICSAAAVPRSYYARFAEYLAEAGRPVLTCDYRGIGGSLDQPIRSVTARMRDWGIHDIPAMIDWAVAVYPGRPVHLVGHSYGGGFGIGLAHNNGHIARHLGVAVPHGYWREMAFPENYRIGALMFAGLPLACALVGYLPGKPAGIGEDLPRGIAMEWRQWILSRDSMFARTDLPELAHYAGVRADMAFMVLADDPWATARATERIAAAFPNARQRRIVELGPADTNGRRVGHLGFFRRGFHDTLWPRARAWLDGAEAPNAN